MTFSGGEPLWQREFLGEVLAGCREAGIHTAVDTCLAVAWPEIEAVRPLVDLFLVDLKHTHDPSVQPKLVIANTRRLADTGARVWLRIPLIPGWNDSVGEMERLAEIARGMVGKVEAAHILPFHGTAENKYRYLGRTWDYRLDHELPEARVNELLGVFARSGVRTVLSGEAAEGIA